MPITDPERRKEVQRAWRARKMKEGYGRALYARRAARYKNEETLRKGTARAIELLEFGTREATAEALDTLKLVLSLSPPVGKPSDYLPKE